MASPWHKFDGINTMEQKGAPARSDTVRRIAPQKKGQHAISFREGGLHASTGTKAGEKIPASKHAAAAAGTLGPKAEKQERFYRNVLKGRGRGR